MLKIFNRQYSKKDPRLKIDLSESKKSLFKIFRKHFKPELINSVEKTFEFDSKNIFIVFDVLNMYFFGNELDRIPFSICSAGEFRDLLVQMNKFEDANYEYYASYIPQYVNSNSDLVRQAIFIIDSYGKMTFKFAVSCMMHEMIHYYDFTKGVMKRIARSGNYARGIEHNTADFKQYSMLAQMEGLKIMPNGYGKTFDELNKEIAEFEFKPLTEDERKANWKKMVDRLKAGEDIPGVALAPNGNVVFIIS